MSVEKPKESPRKIVLVLTPEGRAQKFILEDMAADEPVFAIVAEESDKLVCTSKNGHSLTIAISEIMGKKITGKGMVFAKTKEGDILTEVALEA